MIAGSSRLSEMLIFAFAGLLPSQHLA